jgi:hypothetical protein
MTLPSQADVEQAQQIDRMVSVDQQLDILRMEMEMRSQFFDSMVTHCFRTCIRRLPTRLPRTELEEKHYDWGELTIKEMSCSDRCVQKYIQAQESVKKRIEFSDESKAEQMKKQEAALELVSKFSMGGSK